jgi:hypothetical protein
MPGAAPASDKDEGSGQRGIFRGSIAQRLISLSTLRSESRLSPRKTCFRLLARLCRTGLVTRRVPVKGFTFEMILLFRASWRNVWNPWNPASAMTFSSVLSEVTETPSVSRNCITAAGVRTVSLSRSTTTPESRDRSIVVAFHRKSARISAFCDTILEWTQLQPRHRVRPRQRKHSPFFANTSSQRPIRVAASPALPEAVFKSNT